MSSLLAGLPSTRRGNFSQLGAKQKTRPPAPAVYIPVQDPAAPAPQVIKNDEQTILMRRLYKGRSRLFEFPGSSAGAAVTAAADDQPVAMTDANDGTADNAGNSSTAAKRPGDAIGLPAPKNPRVGAAAAGTSDADGEAMQMQLGP